MKLMTVNYVSVPSANVQKLRVGLHYNDHDAMGPCINNFPLMKILP